MLQIFYKEKPIIISDKKSDLKNSLIINPELFENLDLLKLLTKKRVNSIGIFSNEFEFTLNMFKKKYPEIIAAGGNPPQLCITGYFQIFPSPMFGKMKIDFLIIW